jgi:hypothetical protein
MSRIDVGELSESSSDRFVALEISFGILSIGGWVGPRGDLETANRTRILANSRH